MSVFRQSGMGGGRRWIAAAAGGVLLLTAQVAMGGSRAEASAWETAVVARQVFEAKPPGTHTRAEYSRVMDGFRAIYHGSPSDAHAARAVEQVAELLAEEGREFNEHKSLRDAAGQYEFLAKAYPGGAMAARALGHALDLLEPEAADDVAEARKVRAQLLNDYPRSAEAKNLKRSENRDQRTGDQRTGDQRTADAVVASTSGPLHSGEHYRKPAAVAKTDETPAEKDDVATTDAGANVDGTRAGSGKAEVTYTQPGKMAMVTGIRHWSTPSYTRVAIDLGDAVEYQAAKVENPDRIYFDLHHARLAPQLAGKRFAVTDDGFLTRIRAAQFSGDVTRVVLDVHQVTEYSAFLLP
ncbi:MAG TPA: AMIN domain-containing protein, partial [Acidobacteriaceae bacterium]|nr:AMIN domain-containing protein [Acidobacteriaceae bacterium]